MNERGDMSRVEQQGKRLRMSTQLNNILHKQKKKLEMLIKRINPVYSNVKNYDGRGDRIASYVYKL